MAFGSRRGGTEAGQRRGRDKRGGQGEGRLRCGREGSQGGGSCGRPLEGRHAKGRHGIRQREQSGQHEATAGHGCEESGGRAGRKRVEAGRGQLARCHQGPDRRDQRQARPGQGVGRRQGRRAPTAASLRCGREGGQGG